MKDWHDGAQVSWAHPSPACCAFLQGFGSKMLHSLLLVGPGMWAICRCFQHDARLTTSISHSSVNSAGTRTNNCASEEEELHLVPVWECLTFLHICDVSTERIREQTRGKKTRLRILFPIFINSLQWDWFKRAVINVYLHTKFMTGLFPHHHHSFLTWSDVKLESSG